MRNVNFSSMDRFSKDLFFLPGDVVGTVEELKFTQKMKDLKLGPGLVLHKDTIVATICGFLTISKSSIAWLLNSSRAYIPQENDYVVGKIVKARGNHYKVDLGSNVVSMLPILSFTNATKKVRPQLNTGDLVYARVLLADPNVDYELTCNGCDLKGSALGPLSSSNSFVNTISTSLAHRLLANRQLVKAISPDLPENCEVVVGINGLVYVSSSTLDISIKLVEAFKKIDVSPLVTHEFKV